MIHAEIVFIIKIMTPQIINSPENTLSTNDPGDDTQMRYRYQAGYAALVSLGLLDESLEYEEVFCEHHEDTLIKHGNQFIGVQVKTKETGKEPFKSNDNQITNTIKRFVEQYVNFPNFYVRFVIATNYGFWAQDKDNTKNLYKMLEVAKEAKRNPISKKHRELKSYIRIISDLVNAGGEVSTIVTEEQVLDVLCIIELQENLPKFEDLESRVARSIQQHYDIGDAGFTDLLLAAKALINKTFEAASLEYLSPKQAYFALCNNPLKERTNGIIDGKRIDREIVETILSANLSFHVLLRSTRKISISELPAGMDILEIKMAKGDISVENINLLKDQKFSSEYLLAQWLGKHGSQKAEKQFTHVSSIVRSECAEARDISMNGSQAYGTKMLIEVRKRLRERYSYDPGLFLGCQYEHLLGMAGILTEMCEIWWSEKFELIKEENS